MDWALAIERNRMALLRIVAGLVLMAGPGLESGRLKRGIYLAILSVLRPAEAAMRRLVAVAAMGMETPQAAAPSAPVGAIPKGTRPALPVFQLFDRRKRIAPRKAAAPARAEPRLSGFGFDDPVFSTAQSVMAEDRVDAAQVQHRLTALRDALDDVPKQARRLTRMLARPKRTYTRPMRPGWPPGFRARQRHEIDEILRECHALALHALHVPDTS